MTDRRFPLCWPESWPRTPMGRRRQTSLFKVTEAAARAELIHSLKLFGARDIVLSTNIPLKRDGTLTNCPSVMADPGVAVYFWVNGGEKEIACDCYVKIGWNYRAIGMAIEGMRAIARSGVSEMTERAIAGFAALPERASPSSWREVLGIPPSENVTRDWAISRFKELAKSMHPDNGGTNEAFINLCWARDAAISEAGRSFASALVR
jgi:hypothetical protein